MGTSKQKGANSVKRSKSQPRANLKKKAIKYWGTRQTLFQIARLIGCRQPTVKDIFLSTYGIEAVRARSIGLYRLSKLGKKNPMKDKRFEQHPNWKGHSPDHKGYLTVVKPIWWTGKQKKRIFEHHMIYAHHAGLTCIPAGYDVHHKDSNGFNNNPNNLVMLKKSAHARLHANLRNV